jgi:hypothetical protein
VEILFFIVVFVRCELVEDRLKSLAVPGETGSDLVLCCSSILYWTHTYEGFLCIAARPELAPHAN